MSTSQPAQDRASSSPSHAEERAKTKPKNSQLNPLRLHHLAKIAEDARAAGLPYAWLIQKQRRILAGALPHLLDLPKHEGLARPAAWAEKHLVELVDEMGLSWVEQQAEEQASRRRFRSADDLARDIGQTLEQRTRLKTYTIGAVDCSKAERETLRKAKDAARQRARRAKEEGYTPRPLSIEALAPWELESISRATWHKRYSKEQRDAIIADLRQVRLQQSISSKDNSADEPVSPAETSDQLERARAMKSTTRGGVTSSRVSLLRIVALDEHAADPGAQEARPVARSRRRR